MYRVKEFKMVKAVSYQNQVSFGRKTARAGEVTGAWNGLKDMTHSDGNPFANHGAFKPAILKDDFSREKVIAKKDSESPNDVDDSRPCRANYSQKDTLENPIDRDY